jgi:hypothetical protein
MMAASSFSLTEAPALFFTPPMMRPFRASSSAAVASLTSERSAGQQRTSSNSGAIMHWILPRVGVAAHPTRA